MTPVGGTWWAVYEDGARHFVVPVVCFDDQGAPYVWSAETHAPVPAVRTSFVAIVSDAYRGEYGEVVATAIKHASNGHRGEASAAAPGTTSGSGGDDLKDKLRDGVEKARDVVHDATSR